MKDSTPAYTGEAFRPHMEFWRAQFSTASLSFRLDLRQQGLKQNRAIRSFEFSLGTEQEEIVAKLTGGRELETFIVLLSGLGILCLKYNETAEVIIDSPLYKHDDTQDIRGVGTLPLIIHLNPGDSIKSAILNISQVVTESYKYQDFPLERIARHENPGSGLPKTNVAVCFDGLHGSRLNPAIYDLSMFISRERHQPTTVIRIEYDASWIEPECARQVAKHFQNILSAFWDIHTSVGKLNILGEAERDLILNGFNGLDVGFPAHKTLPEVFEDCVKRRGDEVAVVHGSMALSYRQLNARANQLAHCLRRSGVTPGSIVAIMEERSCYMIVMILGILKAGGAYLPIDMESPWDRIRTVLGDSQSPILLTRRLLVKEFDFIEVTEPSRGKIFNPAMEVLFLDTLAGDLASENPDNPITVNQPTDPAYVMYTSGSTGKPKGVIIGHLNIINLIKNTSYPQIKPSDHVLQFSNYTFDGSTFDIYSALLNGAALYMIDREYLYALNLLCDFIVNQSINVGLITTALLNQLIDYKPEIIGCFDTIYFGGQEASLRHIKTALPYRKNQDSLVNLYGPTEATVFVTFHIVESIEEHDWSIPIGIPINNTKVYILDPGLNPVPVGIEGELYIGGAGVALGYLNNASLTHASFIPSPFIAGDRLYKTGDRARWREGGQIEFAGRKDDQVKIRGFRVELGEVQHNMQKHPHMGQVFLNVRTLSDNTRELVAYFVADKKISAPEMRGHMAKELPDYMIPAHFIQMDHLPLHPTTGKVNKQALPEPDEYHVDTGVDYEAPGTPNEEILVHELEKILRRKGIGINDNYFSLGGDSIKAIQLSSGLTGAGFSLRVDHVFRYPILKGLASMMSQTKDRADQGLITGVTPLTAIQTWFFETHTAGRSHFNQSVLLSSEDRLDAEGLEAVFSQIVAHHDALRMRYKTDRGRVTQEIAGVGHTSGFEVVHLIDQAGSIQDLLMQHTKERQHMDLEHGPLMKAILFRLGTRDLLFIVVHHLVIDSVSWRILLEDLNTGYRQYLAATPLVLPEKTDSFKRWAEQIHRYSSSEELAAEKTFWNQLDREHENPIPRNTAPGVCTHRQCESRSFSLSSHDTADLIRNVHHAYRTGMNDILLTALSGAVQAITGQRRFLITLEGHGREDFLEGLNVNRTLGWFTSSYPVLLDPGNTPETGHRIRHIRECLGKIPHKGFGYGVLKDIAREISNPVTPQIRFNYLGQFDEDMQNSLFKMAVEKTASDISPDAVMDHEIDINAGVSDGQFHMTVAFHRATFKSDTIDAFIRAYEQELQEIISHCKTIKTSIPSPQDLDYQAFDLEGLDRFCLASGFDLMNIDNVYRLTPMQEGLLYHWVNDRDSQAYFQQFCYSIEGTLDIELFKKSWDQMHARYDVLRTVFVYEHADVPLQVVLRTCEADFAYEDLCGLAPDEQAAYLEDFKAKDREAGFDLTAGVPMRLRLFSRGEEDYAFIWSFSHLLLDGWSVGLIQKAFFDIYDQLSRGLQPIGREVKPYSDYIEWIGNKDQDHSGLFWRDYLLGAEYPPALPFSKPALRDDKEASVSSQFHYLLVDLPTAQSDDLKGLAARCGVSLNTVVQTLWGLLLAKYGDTKDVVFGATVSGRPGELDGIEEMVGLFINTVPVRLRIGQEDRFSDLVRRLQSRDIECQEHHYCPLSRIQQESVLKHELLNHVMAFENYPVDEQLQRTNDRSVRGFSIRFESVFEQTNYDFGLVVIPGEHIQFKIGYDEAVYDRHLMQRMEGHLRKLVDTVLEDEEIKIRSIDILPPEEQHLLLADLDTIAPLSAQDKTVVELFEEQVARRPDVVALSYQDSTLTYGELNRLSNRLAHELIDRHHIRPDDLVGLMVGRSAWGVIGILGILKSGAAYVPIDPDYPADRIQFMLEDSRCQVLVTDRRTTDSSVLSDFGPVIDIRDLSHDNGTDPAVAISPDSLAYVIYTSGSTGSPKGVMVEHRGVSNLIYDHMRLVEMTEQDIVLQLVSISFDPSVFILGMTLCSGASLVVADGEMIGDSRVLADHIQRTGVTVAPIMPIYLKNLNDADLQGVRTLITGGESPDVEEILSLSRDRCYINAYGPTETTVCAATYKALPGELQRSRVPIGKPISNMSILILNDELQLMPAGSEGEICIAGRGVARGYLHRPGETAEKFIPNPFRPGVKLYRTGDLGRVLADGNIEFLGRKDTQVKIRGYRVEPGEIEARLNRYPEVDTSAVVTRRSAAQHQELIAFMTVHQKIELGPLLRYLRNGLSEYMIPSGFIILDDMPLLPNGKIDKKRLPEPDDSRLLKEEVNYVAPRNALERELVDIWEAVLGCRDIGIDDNYFALGGDSIKTLQIAARLFQQRLKIETRHISEYPTIAELAPHVLKIDRMADQGPVEGVVPLTPIQGWFFREFNGNQNHFNQAVMVAFKAAEQEGERRAETLKSVMERILEHHDVLRSVYRVTPAGMTQTIHQGVTPCDFEEIDLRGQDEWDRLLESRVQELQRGLRIDTGPLMKSALFRTDHGDRLLMVIHHLVVDGVSWRILMEDVYSAYRQSVAGNQVALPAKTDSYQFWSETMLDYANSDAFQEKASHWEALENAAVTPLPADVEPSERVAPLLRHQGAVSLELSEEATTRLTTKVNRAYGTNTQEILLAAFLLAMKKWRGENRILVLLEGHGRDALGDAADVSRTVGWFTTMYPVLLDVPDSDDLGYVIKVTKETLRRLPSNSAGYGMLREVHPRGNDSLFKTCQTLFNYLGSFDADFITELFEPCDEPVGDMVDPDLPLPFDLMINAIIVRQKLELQALYNECLFKSKTMMKLLDDMQTYVLQMIDHCASVEETEITPSDLTYSELSLDDLENIFNH